MCNPLWMDLPSGSILHVDVEPNPDAGITVVVTTDGADVPVTSLPLSLPIGQGTTHVVTVDAGFIGVDTEVIVRAGVTSVSGAEIRRDDCAIALREAEPFGSDIVTAAGR